MRTLVKRGSCGLIAGFFLAAAYALLPASAASHHPAPAHIAIHYTAAPAQPADKVLAARARLAAMPVSYTAQPGDTLSAIARAEYGSARLWPALWYTNRKTIRNPDALPAGTTLQLDSWHPDKAWVAEKALAAIPKPPPPRPVPAASAVVPAPAPAAAAPAAAPVMSTGSVTPASGYEACVISHESGGNASIVNSSSGAGGLYQFLPSTWASLGYSGLPENAPVAEQQQAFDRLYAQAGSSPWSTDGCG